MLSLSTKLFSGRKGQQAHRLKCLELQENEQFAGTKWRPWFQLLELLLAMSRNQLLNCVSKNDCPFVEETDLSALNSSCSDLHQHHSHCCLGRCHCQSHALALVLCSTVVQTYVMLNPAYPHSDNACRLASSVVAQCPEILDALATVLQIYFSCL